MLHFIQLDHRVPPGLFGEFLNARGIPFRTTHAYSETALPVWPGMSRVIVLGGYMGVHDTGTCPWLSGFKAWLIRLLEHPVPCLGICLGGQLLADVLGATVHSRRHGERGCQPVALTAAGLADPLFRGIPSPFTAFQWHSDSFEIPAQAVHLASSEHCPGQAFRYRNAWGLQFHPEVDETIVADWSRITGAGPQIGVAFARHREAIQRVSFKILTNFLALADR